MKELFDLPLSFLVIIVTVDDERLSPVSFCQTPLH